MSETLTLSAPNPHDGDRPFSLPEVILTADEEPVIDDRLRALHERLRAQEAISPVSDPNYAFYQLPGDLPRAQQSATAEDVDETYKRAAKMADLAIELAINGNATPEYYIGNGSRETAYIHKMAKDIVRIKIHASLAQSRAMALQDPAALL